MTELLRSLIFLLPSSGLKRRLLRIVGVDIGPDVAVGPCLVRHCAHIRLGAGVTIGPGNVFRNLTLLELGDGARIGAWNWISGSPEFTRAPRSLRLGEQAALTSRHYVDATGGVDCGAFSIVAGHRSTILTHGIDYERSGQITAPVHIGTHCLIGTNAVLLGGAVLEDRVVVGGGSVVQGRLSSNSVNVGQKARAVKTEVDGRFFSRTDGYVEPLED